MHAMVVVPTYNECENIDRIIEAVLSLPVDAHVTVVDDNSPDGTGEIADAIAAREERVHVVHRQGKMGLGSAYIAGFKYALQQDPQHILEMDADFSHDPGALPEFLEAIKDQDLVLGSRYLDGITVMNWPLSRLFLSGGANIYTRFITGMP